MTLPETILAAFMAGLVLITLFEGVCKFVEWFESAEKDYNEFEHSDVPEDRE